MTREQLEALSPRELDAVVAEKVMGIQVALGRTMNPEGFGLPVLSYSSTYEGMGLVLERMWLQGFNSRLDGRPLGERYWARFFKSGVDKEVPSKSLPGAVAIAAVLAVGEK